MYRESIHSKGNKIVVVWSCDVTSCGSPIGVILVLPEVSRNMYKYEKQKIMISHLVWHWPNTCWIKFLPWQNGHVHRHDRSWYEVSATNFRQISWCGRVVVAPRSKPNGAKYYKTEERRKRLDNMKSKGAENASACPWSNWYYVVRVCNLRREAYHESNSSCIFQFKKNCFIIFSTNLRNPQ